MGEMRQDILFFAHKFIMPKVEIDRIVMHHKQNEIYLPGKDRVGTAEVSFYRAHVSGGDAVAQQIYAWWATRTVDYKKSTLVAGKTGGPPKSTVRIEALDGAGRAVHTYVMYGVWPSATAPDPFDFSDNNVSDITLTLQVDKIDELISNPTPVPMNMCGDGGNDGDGVGDSGNLQPRPISPGFLLSGQ